MQFLAGAYAAATGANSQLDARAKMYGDWILDHVCKGDKSKIVGAKVVVNPRTDGFGIAGGQKFHTRFFNTSKLQQY